MLPCLCIVCCYARIFYIVRKTAMKTHEVQPSKANGSIRMSHNHGAAANNGNKIPPNLVREISKESHKIPEHRHRLSFQIDMPDNDNNKDDTHSVRSKMSQNSSSNFQKPRKYLSKTQEEDLKFIDTSVESDLPPTLSKLQRKSVQISVEQQPFMSSPSSPTPTTADTVTTAIVSLASEQLNSISRDVDGLAVGNTRGSSRKNSHDYRDTTVDSAVEDSTTTSIDQVRKINLFLLSLCMMTHIISRAVKYYPVGKRDIWFRVRVDISRKLKINKNNNSLNSEAKFMRICISFPTATHPSHTKMKSYVTVLYYRNPTKERFSSIIGKLLFIRLP